MEDEKLLYHLNLILLNSVSFIFNLLIVIIFIRYRKQFFLQQGLIRRLRAQRNHSKYLLSMVIADLLVALFGTVTGVLLKLVQNRLIYKLCGLIPLYSSMFVSVFSLILLTFDRLAAIKCPLPYDSLMSNSCITKSIVLCWTFPILTTISQMILYVTYGSSLELKVRNTILTIVCLTGFFILIITNYILIKKYKQQGQRSVKLMATSRQLMSASRGSFYDEFHTSMERVSNICEDKPCRTSLAPVYEGHKVSSSLEAADGLDEKLCQSRNSVALCVGHRSSNASEKHPVDRKDIPTKQLHQNQNTKDYLTVPSSIMISDHTVTNDDCNESERISLNIKLESDFSSEFQPSHTPKKVRVMLKLNKKIPERKITIMCICIIMTFLVCWLPLVGYRFSYVVGRTTVVPWFRRLTQCLALSNSLLNPFIYVMMRKDFRELLKRLLGIGNKKFEDTK